MVRLRGAHGDEGVGAFGESITHQKLQFSRFVASEGEAGLIVALDEQLRPTEFSRKRFQFFNRRGQLSQG